MLFYVLKFRVISTAAKLSEIVRGVLNGDKGAFETSNLIFCQVRVVLKMMGIFSFLSLVDV